MSGIVDLRDWIRGRHRAVRAGFVFDVLKTVPRELLTRRPDVEGNSIAWLMWHVARSEDLAVNALIRRRHQVLDTGDWCGRMGVSDRRIGVGATSEDVEELGRSVVVEELDEYWAAVHSATGEWLTDASIDELSAVPDTDAAFGEINQIVPEEGAWVRDRWRGRTVEFVLGSVVIDHGFVHLGEMQAVKGRLGIRGL